MKRFLIRLFCFSVVMFLLLEGLLRTVIPAAEAPFTGVNMKYLIQYDEPSTGREGRYSVGRFGQHTARWRINDAGWNSEVEYSPASKRTKPLVAIIGHSFIQSLHVDFTRNVASILRRLTRGSHEVYKFGVSGAPFSGYLPISRLVQDQFKPEVMIYLLTEGSLRGSLVSHGRRAIFSQIEKTDSSFREVKADITYNASPIRRAIYRSAIVRYITVNIGLEPNLSIIFKRPDPQQIVKVSKQKQIKKREYPVARYTLHRRAASWIVRQLKESNRGSRVVLVLDADRKGIYRGSSKELEQNMIIRDVCAEEKILCIDLTKTFKEHYSRECRSFNFSSNTHWNEYGHRVVGTAIYQALVKQGFVEREGT
jgi:hypothetical protein